MSDAIPSPDAELVVEHGLIAQARLHLLLDGEGRHLGEWRVPPESRAPGFEMELRRCPYEDSRQGHENPMNVSALRQMTKHWKELLSYVRYFRTLYLEDTGVSELRYRDAQCVGQLITMVPWFLWRRREPALGDHPVPPVVGSAFKLVLGFNPVTSMLNVDALLAEMGGDEGPPVTPERVWEEADGSGLLIGPEQVCAGPRHMFSEALAAFLLGAGEGDFDADVTAAEVARVLPDLDAFRSYAYGTYNFIVVQYLLRNARRLILDDLARATWEREDVPAALTEAIGAAHEAMPATLLDQAVNELDDDERTVMSGVLGVVVPDLEGLPHDGAVQVAGAIADDWTRPREELAALTGRRLAPRADLPDDVAAVVLDRALVHGAMAQRVGHYIEGAERRLYAALGRDPPKLPPTAVILKQLYGDELERVFSVALTGADPES